jgi:hypothetical protein
MSKILYIIPSPHLLALTINWGAATHSPERLVEPLSRMPKSGGTLPKTRAFLGKVEENVAKALIYKFNPTIHSLIERPTSPCITSI